MSQLYFSVCCHDLRPVVNEEAHNKCQSNESILLELNESKTVLENIEESYYEKMFKGGSKLINTREITEKLSEIDIPDDFIFFKKKILCMQFLHKKFLLDDEQS
ncbi:23253_t:CDS:2 [Cetraspora pellucida]|uniref:23253_t:CDS:1 n=1 Tax=Cetraspora pellucida TaxID=1433469 RepID=A0A9N9EMK6_9GLOM|nr:23253_t:CDS:2 [Cetraspora pellucida]